MTSLIATGPAWTGAPVNRQTLSIAATGRKARLLIGLKFLLESLPRNNELWEKICIV